MRDRRQGGTLVPALMLLVVLMAGGGFNYYRNWQIEQADPTPRPFHAYADDDLEALATAYQAEINDWNRRVGRQGRVKVRDHGLIGERVAEFERVRNAASRQRDLVTEVAEREARLREIRSEQSLRSQTQTGMALHLARLTGLP